MKGIGSFVSKGLLRPRAACPIRHELVQDTFVEVWRSATRYDPRRAAPERWILTMVRTRAIDRLRQNGARGRLPPAPA